ncbi:MAG: dipicolinate synthase subunit DpsA [Thermincola sp.]|jgi:dipicolinate synthase subunit A|nr:dipicolinate synthase subunit DpsA [Thermincola sp.]MDT3701711.1 dipicolinate synthase subunit DpsA [Thermincola sp.]
MSSKLAGVTVAVLGGDDRELILVSELLKMGANVKVAGISRLNNNQNVQCFHQIVKAVQDAAFVVLPMPGIDQKGIIRAKYSEIPLVLDQDTIQSFPPDCMVIVGYARPLLKELVSSRNLKLTEIAEMDEVAIPNSIPSAEGALQMAMEATDITIHGSKCLVLGFGRCGCTLARMAAALGAKTIVAARRPRDLARISEMGFEPITYQDLAKHIGEADIIFNTVPSLILDRELLELTDPAVYICDIASAPGGVDFTAAGELKRRAELAPGLPGKVAPRTAGRILARVIPEIMLRELTHTSFSNFNRNLR